MFKARSYVGHKLCGAGDLVINTMWAWMAALGVARQCGIISPGYAVYRPRNPSKLLDTFVDSLLRTQPYVSNYICRSTGIRLSRLRLYPEQFLRMPVIVPPLEEQQAIVQCLTVETAALSSTIAYVDAQIALLREYRTRLISDVVTGQLDVREAVKSLPPEDPNAHQNDDIDDVLDDGEEIEEDGDA